MFRKFLFVIVTVVFFLGSLASIGIADKDEHQSWGKPFRQLWNMIKRLERRITALEAEPRVQGVEVHDAAGQHLGILVDYHMAERNTSPQTASGLIGIYVPVLDRIAYLNIITGEIDDYFQLLYENRNCKGQPYIYSPYVIHKIWGERRYVAGSGELTQLNLRSYYSFANGCTNYNGSNPRHGFPVLEISETEIPISLPVALPLKFITKSD